MLSSPISGRCALPGALAIVAALAAVLVVCLVPADRCLATWPPWARDEPAPDPVYPDVTVDAEWLAGHLRDAGVVIVDARDRESYLKGHVPTAISIPASSLPGPRYAASAFAENGLSGRGRIVCYGDGTLSGDAARLFWLLEVAGAERPVLLEGGLRAWVGAGGEPTKESRDLPATEWRGVPRYDLLATQEYVRQSYGEPGYEIVDARGRDKWEGAATAPASGVPVRAGHVPHSLPFDFGEFVGSDGSLRPPEQTREIFSALGPRPTSPVDLQDEFVVYGDGVTGNGAVGYFLLRRAGIATLRCYPGGWEQWSTDTSLPVVRLVGAEELEARLAAEQPWWRRNALPSTFALFDVRHDSDWTRGHVPGSVNITSSQFADSLEILLERHWPELDRTEAAIVTYCYGPNCIRSRHTSTVAARAGFLRVERFYGGVEDWRGIGGRFAK